MCAWDRLRPGLRSTTTSADLSRTSVLVTRRPGSWPSECARLTNAAALVVGVLEVAEVADQAAGVSSPDWSPTARKGLGRHRVELGLWHW